ncbi:CP family cyanate transporter-like MFS transporter [Actinocorallia herbida]|uniref:CP family cyanate transporter-like MFS transporter n=1 Tax=Actinocorallia herbida TaxID=58109 RepID=A0A3N1DDD5_9ACTN|nr:MFS transporter [Actinocorallia herbida]ROO91168.1 CP family cyanate transporter-like MFS transporter [Actinocorallia herbida]
MTLATPLRRATAAGPVVALILLVSLNLRPGATTVGPLLPEIRAGIGLNGFTAGLLTALPPLCFAAFGPLAPRIARRFGAAGALGVGMLMLAAGIAVRSLAGGPAVFLLCTMLALGGIAIANVLMPSVVKREFPQRVGLMTGIYTAVLTIGAATGAALAVPVAEALGSWRSGLSVWGVIALVALIIAVRCRGLTARTDGGPRTLPPLRRSRTAWGLAVFFMVNATAAYFTMGWMPQIYQDAGFSPNTAGLLLALCIAIGIPLAFVMPVLATRRPNQRALVAVLLGTGVIAYGGLAFWPSTMPWLWALLSGISQSAFPLALALIGLRARTDEGVTLLSSFAQSTGYLCAVPGPIIMGVAYQWTGGWEVPLLFLIALLVPALIGGLRAASPHVLEDEL